VAVSLTAPSVFRFTAPSAPARHRDALSLFVGKERLHEVDRVRDEDLGPALSEEIQRFLEKVGVPRGLSKVGYQSGDVAKVSLAPGLSVRGAEDRIQLVEGCLPQRRVLDLAPVLSKDNKEEERAQLTGIIEESMTW
jgi:hydroxyacid-oxoacid transhydrogenase